MAAKIKASRPRGTDERGDNGGELRREDGDMVLVTRAPE